MYGRSVGCVLCHGQGGGTERNAYGAEWAGRGEDLGAFRRIEAMDSDGDGQTNGVELERWSNPGDARSTPDDPGEAWTDDRAQTLVPTEQLELVFERVDRIDAVEADLDDAKEAALARALGRRPTFDEAHPTFYLAVVEGRRAAVAVFSLFRAQGRRLALLVSATPEAHVSKIALFRTGEDEEAGSRYQPFLRCLAGHGKDDVPAPGADGCPAATGPGGVERAMADAVRTALWTISTALAAETPAVPEPAEADTGAAPRTATAPLDLERPRATARVEVMSSGTATAGAIGAIALLFALVFATTRLALRFGADGARPNRLGALSPAGKALAGLVLVSLLAVQAIAALDVWMQTRVVHESAWAYFQYLTWARLLGTSHAHVFGYAILYGTLGLLVTKTGAKDSLQAGIVSALLWSGLFDVASWWAIKRWSPRFEWLTITTGIVTASASLVAAAIVVRALAARPRDS